MPVPTHGPSCKKLFCRPSRCQGCGEGVFYWACTCGSSVLFDKLGEPWPKHQCTSVKSTRRKGRSERVAASVAKLMRPSYGVLSTICPRCGKSVRNRELDAHNYWTHKIGKKPEPERRPKLSTKRALQNAASARKAGNNSVNKPLVICPRCGSKVSQKNLQKHLSKKCLKRQR
jgi:hypothetical protein